MDERLKLTRSVSGQTEFRINHTTLLELGQDWLAGELLNRGIYPDDLGEPVVKRGIAHIPIRRET